MAKFIDREYLGRQFVNYNGKMKEHVHNQLFTPEQNVVTPEHYRKSLETDSTGVLTIVADGSLTDAGTQVELSTVKTKTPDLEVIIGDTVVLVAEKTTVVPEKEIYRKVSDSYSKEEVDNLVGNGTDIDLSEYAKTVDVETNYAKKTDLSEYTKTVDIETTYAKKTDIAVETEDLDFSSLLA